MTARATMNHSVYSVLKTGTKPKFVFGSIVFKPLSIGQDLSLMLKTRRELTLKWFFFILLTVHLFWSFCNIDVQLIS